MIDLVLFQNLPEILQTKIILYKTIDFDRTELEQIILLKCRRRLKYISDFRDECIYDLYKDTMLTRSIQDYSQFIFRYEKYLFGKYISYKQKRNEITNIDNIYDEDFIALELIKRSILFENINVFQSGRCSCCQSLLFINLRYGLKFVFYEKKIRFHGLMCSEEINFWKQKMIDNEMISYIRLIDLIETV